MFVFSFPSFLSNAWGYAIVSVSIFSQSKWDYPSIVSVHGLYLSLSNTCTFSSLPDKYFSSSDSFERSVSSLWICGFTCVCWSFFCRAISFWINCLADVNSFSSRGTLFCNTSISWKRRCSLQLISWLSWFLYGAWIPLKIHRLKSHCLSIPLHVQLSSTVVLLLLAMQYMIFRASSIISACRIFSLQTDEYG